MLFSDKWRRAGQSKKFSFTWERTSTRRRRWRRLSIPGNHFTSQVPSVFDGLRRIEKESHVSQTTVMPSKPKDERGPGMGSKSWSVGSWTRGIQPSSAPRFAPKWAVPVVWLDIGAIVLADAKVLSWRANVDYEHNDSFRLLCPIVEALWGRAFQLHRGICLFKTAIAKLELRAFQPGSSLVGSFPVRTDSKGVTLAFSHGQCTTIPSLHGRCQGDLGRKMLNQRRTTYSLLSAWVPNLSNICGPGVSEAKRYSDDAALFYQRPHLNQGRKFSNPLASLLLKNRSVA